MASGVPAADPLPIRDAVLVTGNLWRRPARQPDYQAENEVLLGLAEEMAASPGTVLQMLAERLRVLCRADSAGISILDATGEHFHWPAIAGPLAAHLGGAILRADSPCGIVIERDAVQLFDRPERAFRELQGADPPLTELLLAPFHVGSRPVGTVWVVAHGPERQFDGEDARLLGSVARFASAARQMAAALAEARGAHAVLEQEIGERAEAEAALRTAHARTIEILESLTDAFYAIDRDGCFTYVNGRAEELWGRPRQALLGRRAQEVFPHLTGSPLEKAVRHVMRDRQPRHMEVRSSILGAWFEAAIHPTMTGGASIYLRDISERKRVEERQRLLMREVDHRAKNVLAVVQAALRLTRAPDVPSYARALEGRIAALARAQTLLAQDRWTGADLRELITGEFVPFLGEGVQRVRLDGPSVALPPGAAQPLAMALHELATNAVKHGALSMPAGRVAIRWSVEDGPGRVLRLRWAESGGPPIRQAPARRGFGSRVLNGTLCRQLGGSLGFGWEPEGLVCTMAIPLAPPSGASAADTA